MLFVRRSAGFVSPFGAARGISQARAAGTARRTAPPCRWDSGHVLLQADIDMMRCLEKRKLAQNGLELHDISWYSIPQHSSLAYDF